MLRKLTILLVAATVDDPYIQITLGVTTMGIALLAHTHFQPYELSSFNRLETIGLSCLTLTQLLSVLYLRVEVEAESLGLAVEDVKLSSTEVIITVFLAGINCISLMLHCTVVAHHYWRKPPTWFKLLARCLGVRKGGRKALPTVGSSKQAKHRRSTMLVARDERESDGGPKSVAGSIRRLLQDAASDDDGPDIDDEPAQLPAFAKWAVPDPQQDRRTQRVAGRRATLAAASLAGAKAVAEEAEKRRDQRSGSLSGDFKGTRLSRRSRDHTMPRKHMQHKDEKRSAGTAAETHRVAPMLLRLPAPTVRTKIANTLASGSQVRRSSLA